MAEETRLIVTLYVQWLFSFYFWASLKKSVGADRIVFSLYDVL